MTLVPLTLALAESKRRGGALAAFNVIQIEHAEAYAAAAAQTDLPVVMQISENCVRYHGALRPIGLATLAIAEAAPSLWWSISTTPRTARWLTRPLNSASPR